MTYDLLIALTWLALVATITPGPNNVMVMASGANYGFRRTLPHMLGIAFGFAFMVLLVGLGLAQMFTAIPQLKTALTVAGIAYLLYLAAKIALAGSRIAFIESAIAPGLTAGLLLQTINPKAYAVNTTLYAGFPFAPENLIFETLVKVLIFNAIWIPIHLAWLWAGASLHRLNLSPAAQRRINYVMAASMLAVVALALMAGLRAK